MLYTLTNSFTRISETTGTIQNTSSRSVEVSDRQSLGSGVVLKPGEIFSFSDSTYYARCEGARAVVRVVPFMMGAGGSATASSANPGSAETSGDSTNYPADIDDIWNDLGDPTQEMWDNPTSSPYDDEFDKVIDDIYGFNTP